METTTKKGTLLKGLREVAAFYKCSTTSISNLVKNGSIPSYRIGRNRYFYSDEIDSALKEATTKN